MEKIDLKSKDITSDNIQKIKQLFPEVFTEDKIDFDKLRLVLGDNIEKENEIYEFTWNGKSKAMREAQKQSTGTLRPDKESSKNWDTTENLYIEGDNLEVLKLLQKSYHNKIKMIYIDPPYNTGNDFIYKDDYKDNLKNYIEKTNQALQSNPETSGRYHSDWLNMMYPRLKLARNLMTEDGVIFISIDDNEVHNLKKICDEIYGEENFIGIITWEKKRKGSYLSKNIVSLTEYCLVYCKDINQSKVVGGKADQSESQPLIKRTNNVKTLCFPENLIFTKLEDKTYKSGVYGNGSSAVELLNDVIVENGKIKSQMKIKGPFIWTQAKVDEQIEKGAKFVVNTENFQIRCFKINDENKYKGFPSIIKGVEIKGTNEDAYEEMVKLFGAEKIFDYSKPKNYIKEFIRSQSYEREPIVVLDFFSGSASTAHAVMQLNAEDDGNRKFIMVQLPEPTDEKSEAYKAGYKNICEIGKERIRRAGEKIKEETGKEDLDIGFKVFKLDSSNFKMWDSEPENLQLLIEDMVEHIKADRTDEDVLYEIMLKYGLELTYRVEELDINNKKVYSIGAGALVVCLEKEIDLSLVEEIAKMHPLRVVFRESGFKNDVVKTNAIQILKQNGIEEIKSV